jgi:hypothetical protein
VQDCNLAEQKNQNRKEMKRKSLKFKMQEIAKIGTLRTYSREEALEYCVKEYSFDVEFMNKQIEETKDSYDRGLILCLFTAYPEKANSLNTAYISQRSKSLAEFVDHIAYPINF